MGNASAEVRRRACEHLAAHPDPAHVPVLIPALEDKDHAVVCAAARALAATGKMPDTKPLRNLLGSTNEDMQLEAALALTRLGDPSGKPALERLAYSRDPVVRAKTAQAMGDFPDPAFTATLIHLLNDNQTVARAALISLPKVVGEDVAQAPGQAPRPPPNKSSAGNTGTSGKRKHKSPSPGATIIARRSCVRRGIGELHWSRRDQVPCPRLRGHAEYG